MRVLILSTPTKHHTYFINKLAARFDIAQIIYERRTIAPPFATGPFYDREQDEFEARFFDPRCEGTAHALPPQLAERVVEVHSVNQRALATYITALGVDVAVSFGTGAIKPYIFEAPVRGTINVHRGIAERYRGLDSDLWALFQKDFREIGVTIHSVDHRAPDPGAPWPVGDALHRDRVRRHQPPLLDRQR